MMGMTNLGDSMVEAFQQTAKTMAVTHGNTADSSAYGFVMTDEGATRQPPLSVSGDPGSIDWEESPARAEAAQFLATLLFSLDYISADGAGRHAAMGQLYKFHKGMREGHRRVDKGVALLIDGLLKAKFNHKSVLERMNVPLLLIGSAEDAIVNPEQSRDIAESRGVAGDGGMGLKGFADLLTQPAESMATHILWLKAGHQVLQERRSFIARQIEQVLLGQLIERPLTPDPNAQRNAYKPTRGHASSSKPDSRRSSAPPTKLGHAMAEVKFEENGLLFWGDRKGNKDGDGQGEVGEEEDSNRPTSEEQARADAEARAERLKAEASALQK